MKVDLIKEFDSKGVNSDPAYVLHRLFNNMPRMKWNNVKDLKFDNGIYIMFENGETYQGMDRVVRVGTHRADGRLVTRLNNHFTSNNADSSIFRKNIGRALLSRDKSSYQDVWELNTSKSEIRELHKNEIDLEFENELESTITNYLKDNITFVCFKVDTEEERLRLEEGIISTLSRSNIQSSKEWLGLNHTKKEVVESRLWNIQGVNGKVLTYDELIRIGELCNSNLSIQYKNNINSSYKKCSTYIDEKEGSNDEKVSVIGEKISTNDIRFFIRGMICSAKLSRLEYVDIVSGQVHKAMNLSSKMPSVCSAMYSIKEYKYEILETVPSGKSSTIKIRYYL
ncbi:MAG: hypothetical protein RR898_01460 [Clostridium sp.]|uniref:hypothetical protein n=1 Tax=Clostridium sp. TaxID=1506 RepID=UPI002FC62EAF